MRIGLVSDTHDNLCDWPAVCARVSAALDGVDLVVHCGDITTLAVLDDLERVAPVRATRNTDDPEPIPGRLDDGPIVIDADGAAIGVTFSLPDPREGTDWAAMFGPSRRRHRVRGLTRAGDRAGRRCAAREPGSPSLAAALTVGELVVGDGPPRAHHRRARSVIGGLDAPLAVLEHEQVRGAARGDDLHAGLTPALVGGPPPLVEHPRP